MGSLTLQVVDSVEGFSCTLGYLRFARHRIAGNWFVEDFPEVQRPLALRLLQLGQNQSFVLALFLIRSLYFFRRGF